VKVRDLVPIATFTQTVERNGVFREAMRKEVEHLALIFSDRGPPCLYSGEGPGVIHFVRKVFLIGHKGLLDEG
jgi:hypothetical protein